MKDYIEKETARLVHYLNLGGAELSEQEKEYVKISLEIIYREGRSNAFQESIEITKKGKI